MDQKSIKNSTFINDIFISFGIILVPIVFIGSRFGLLPNFIVSKSHVISDSSTPIITNFVPLNHNISLENKNSSDLYDKKLNFEEKCSSNKEISTDLKSQNLPSLVEIYLSFAESFRDSQMKSMTEAIGKLQKTSFQKNSAVFSSETRMQNLSLYKNNKDSKSSLDLFAHPAAREIALLSETSPKTQKTASDYFVLVGVGPKLEYQDTLTELVTTPNLDFFRKLETLLKKLANLENIHLGDIQKVNDCLQILVNQFEIDLNEIVKFSIEKRKLGKIHLTQFDQGNFPSDFTSKSGISAYLPAERQNQIVEISLKNFNKMFQEDYVPHLAEAFRQQALCFQKLRHELYLINQNLADFKSLKNQDFQPLSNQLLNVVQNVENQKGTTKLPVGKITQSIINLQCYFHPICEINPVFSVNFRNKNLSLGFGKAHFYSFSKFENFGVLAGMDVGFHFNTQTRHYQGLKVTGFVGVGISV